MAAIDCVRIGGSAGSTSAANNYNSSSWTPTNGRRAYAIVASRRAAGEPNVPTVTGNNQTWAQVGSSVYIGDLKLSLFSCLVASATASATNAAFSSQTQDSCSIATFEFISVDGSDPHPQTPATASVSGGTTFTCTLGSAFVNAWSGVLIVMANSLNDTTLRPEAGWSTPMNGSAGYWAVQRTTQISVSLAFKPTNDSACAVTMASGNGAGILTELKQDGSDVGGGGLAMVARGQTRGMNH